jgi:glutamate racemase
MRRCRIHRMDRLGIIDWGIGGISLVKLLKERRSGVPVIYFSDTGVMPYGKMTQGQLVSRLNAVIAFLRQRGMTHLLIGCNAASTAVPFLDQDGIEIEGVIKSAVAATLRLRPERLGLIGGRRTVLSGVYRRAFARHGIAVSQRIAQPLSGLIEAGDVGSDRLRAQCKRILTPLKRCSHILLACTHYPAITSTMKDLVSPETLFIDPAPALLDAIDSWPLTPGGEDIFLTSGDAEAMKIAARTAFGVHIHRVVRAAL